MTTKLVDRGWNNIKTQIKRLQGTEITVGVQGQEARLKDPDSDVTVVDYAVYNHFGTRHIPARPFLQMALDNNKKEIKAFITKNINFLMKNENAKVSSALDRIGAFLVGEIQREITNGTFAPNSPKTIKMKGHTKPLIGGRLAYTKRDGTKVAAETGGRLRSSITYEIRY